MERRDSIVSQLTAPGWWATLRQITASNIQIMVKFTVPADAQHQNPFNVNWLQFQIRCLPLISLFRDSRLSDERDDCITFVFKRITMIAAASFSFEFTSCWLINNDRMISHSRGIKTILALMCIVVMKLLSKFISWRKKYIFCGVQWDFN